MKRSVSPTITPSTQSLAFIRPETKLPLRKRIFTKEFYTLSLRKSKEGFSGKFTSFKNYITRKNKNEKRILKVEAVVSKQNEITLPAKFIAGEIDFKILLSAVIAYKKQTFAEPTNRNDPFYNQKLLAYNNNKPLNNVTSLEL